MNTVLSIYLVRQQNLLEFFSVKGRTVSIVISLCIWEVQISIHIAHVLRGKSIRKKALTSGKLFLPEMWIIRYYKVLEKYSARDDKRVAI